VLAGPVQIGDTNVQVFIREVSFDDAEGLQQYASKLFAERLPGLYERPAPSLDDERAYVASHLTRDNSTLLAAFVDGRVAGLAGILGRDLPQESHVGMVGVSVDQDFRGRGVGTSLLTALLEWAPRHDLIRVEIEAFANNPRAIELYERLGFAREGVRRGAVLVDGEYIDVVGLAQQVGGA
jgi:RimJ/RimL family protein N-acetyltransferase